MNVLYLITNKKNMFQAIRKPKTQNTWTQYLNITILNKIIFF